MHGVQSIGDDIWCHDATYTLGALAIPHRMTVTRGASGGVIVHSPCRPDEATRGALDALGPVESIVWPSWWHDLYFRAWAQAYPRATCYVAPALQRLAAGDAHVHVLDSSTVPAGLDMVFVDRLRVWMDECVFLHRPSRSLIVADLVVNVPHSIPQPARTFFALMGAFPGPRIPWFYRWVARDRRRLAERLRRILDWDFDALVMGHGDLVRSGAHAAFVSCVEQLRLNA